MSETDLDLVSRLAPENARKNGDALRCISPDDAKYGDKSKALSPYLSAEAEWRGCALVQKKLIETREEFGQAEDHNVREVRDAILKISPLNMSLIEAEITKHDQLAVIEEIGRYVSSETKALLHPGTTSYDILDTARSYLFKEAWFEVIRHEVEITISKMSDLAEKSKNTLQVGRTHLQDTAPITFGGMLGGYVGRLSDRVHKCDAAFNDLRGKVSGIVGTGASVDAVIGNRRSMKFEREALAKLGLKPDYTATQVVQKERLVDVGNGIVTLMHVLGDFSNDMRILYSSAIQEVTSRANAERLGGSSADAMKNNPINYENICGKVAIVESGMGVLYRMIQTDLQRDLRGSVMARYQPQGMMAETYEAFTRVNKALDNLSINEDKMSEHLQPVRDNPSEPMVAILRGEKWVHTEYGVGHDFVKEMGKKAKLERRNLMEVSLEDPEFQTLYVGLSKNKQEILNGKLEKYTGSSQARLKKNLEYGKQVLGEGFSLTMSKERD